MFKPSGIVFDLPTKKSRISELTAIQSDPTFWSERFDRSIPQEQKELEDTVSQFEELSSTVEECQEFLLWDEVDLLEIQSMLAQATKALKGWELSLKFTGDRDRNGAIISLHAGSGGTESQYWVEVLYRAYLMYASNKGWSVEQLDCSFGSVSGMKSVTFSCEGKLVYGHMKAEKGTHRFCRVSPFDSSGRVHTSFLAVDVVPLVEEKENDIKIPDTDIEVSTYKSSGPGGQHANKADSAVRIKHLPTGIVVQCQTDRSQIRNRASAHQMLISALKEKERLALEEEASNDWDSKSENAFGHQIRSYELHQGSYIKDHRTGYKHQQPDTVLNGNFDPLINSYLLAGREDTNLPDANEDSTNYNKD